MTTSAEVPTIQVTLNPVAVRSLAQLVAAESNEAVSFFLNSLVTADLSVSPEPPKGSMVYKLSAAFTADQRRDAFKSWIVAKGIQELIRGLRQTLEEAYFFSDALKQLPSRTTVAELDKLTADIRRRANKLNYPQLITEVQSRLTSAMTYEKEILSLVAVRNCLEHRHGIVGAADADANGQLSLTLPRLQTVAIVEGKEIEIGPGYVSEASTQIGIKRVNRERTYRLGEKIEIDAAQFQEIAFACHLFAEDIASKLPTS